MGVNKRDLGPKKQSTDFTMGLTCCDYSDRIRKFRDGDMRLLPETAKDTARLKDAFIERFGVESETIDHALRFMTDRRLSALMSLLDGPAFEAPADDVVEFVRVYIARFRDHCTCVREGGHLPPIDRVCEFDDARIARFEGIDAFFGGIRNELTAQLGEYAFMCTVLYPEFPRELTMKNIGKACLHHGHTIQALFAFVAMNS